MSMALERAPVVIEVRDLTTRFGQTVIHNSLDLDVCQGEIIGVVGGSGTGKSVLLRAIVGLLRPRQGTIKVFGENLSQLSERQRRHYEQRWGVLFQNGALFSSLTVGQNIQVPLREHLQLTPRLLEEIAALKLGLAGLEPGAIGKYPSELSGGMRKRAALARALALDPEILFLDEPTAGLDPIAAAEFDDLIKDLQRALGFTVFLVTHDLDTLHTVCDRIAVLGDGKILVIGTISELLVFDHPWVNEYFCGPRGRAASLAQAKGATR